MGHIKPGSLDPVPLAPGRSLPLEFSKETPFLSEARCRDLVHLPALVESLSFYFIACSLKGNGLVMANIKIGIPID